MISIQKRLLCSSLLASVIILSVGVALVDVNRFFGKKKNSCGDYSDSSGGVDENGTRVCQAEHNKSEKTDPGIVFGNTGRSELAWGYISALSILSIVLSLGSYLYRVWERHQSSGDVTKGQQNEHSGEHRRICLVLYVCTGLVLLHHAVVVVKVVRCHREFAEGFYTVVILLSLLVQGVYLVYEVNHRSVNQVASGHFFRSVLFSQAILNLALWADALFDVACRIEPDNAIFFGDDFWLICKPIFKAALVALRILSALLFLMLAMHSDDHGDVSVEVPDGGKATKLETFEPAESGKKEHRNKTNDQQNRDEKTLKKTRKYEEHVDGLERALEHIENAVRNLLCDDNNTPDGTNDPVVHDENRLSKFVRLLSIRPDVNYGVVIRLSRIKDNSFQFVAEAISSKQVGTEALMHSLSFLGLILILIPPVVLGWALKLLEGDDAAKYVPELIIHVIIISCCIFILLPHSPVNHWKIKTHVPVVTRLKNLVHDPELSAITIFGIAANWYHILLFSFYCKDHELFIDALPQVDVFVEIVSATLRLWVVWIFKMRHGATFRKRNDTLTEVVLGILTACSLSVLIMDIQREEFSDNEHTLVHHLHMEWVESVLGVLAPLSVDFSLHGALLLYSVFYDYIKFSGEPGFVGDETDDVVMHVESIV